MIKVGDNLKYYLLNNNNNSHINHAIATYLGYYYKSCNVVSWRCLLKNTTGNKIIQIWYSYRNDVNNNIFLLYQNDKLYNFVMVRSVGKIKIDDDKVSVYCNYATHMYINSLNIK